jgi:hypothetical protein
MIESHSKINNIYLNQTLESRWFFCFKVFLKVALVHAFVLFVGLLKLDIEGIKKKIEQRRFFFRR